ncbi:unnamed protein product [Symbiodinium sp. CCMP2592]|nr:unnamed protein product [Symbiodinium sp. CCMP2592]
MAAYSARVVYGSASSGAPRKFQQDVHRKRGSSGPAGRRPAEERRAEKPGGDRPGVSASGGVVRPGSRTVHEARHADASQPVPVPLSRIHAALERRHLERAAKPRRQEEQAVQVFKHSEEPLQEGFDEHQLLPVSGAGSPPLQAQPAQTWEDRPERVRPRTSSGNCASDDRPEPPPRPSTPCMNRGLVHTEEPPEVRVPTGSSPSDAQSELPPRPTTPCMNRGGDGMRRKRTSSAGRPGRGVRPASGSVGSRMHQLESRLLNAHQQSGSEAPAQEAPRQVRPASSGGRCQPQGAARVSQKLVQEAMEMCRQSKAAGSNSAATVCSTADGTETGELPASPALSPPPERLERPQAPTPEQTNHWLQGMECSAEPEASMEQPSASTQYRVVSPARGSDEDGSAQCMRPRSPTPTKMLAWGEEQDSTPSGGPSSRPLYGSPASDEDDPFGRGDHSDGLINRLIEACQMDDVRRAFGIYERLRRMEVPLYEGVYKLIIECCTRTHQLGHGIQFYETLKSSGQRVSSRLLIVLIEACAREQHSDKVYALWQDSCPRGEEIDASQREVLLVTLSSLVRTMSPDLALEILRDTLQRYRTAVAWLVESQTQVKDLLQLVVSAASEAQLDRAGQLGHGLLASYRGLEDLLQWLLEEADRQMLAFPCKNPALGSDSPTSIATRPPSGRAGTGFAVEDEMLLMEDVDLDLELAAM